MGEHARAEEQAPRRSGGSGFALRVGIGLLVIAQSMILSLGINLEEDTPSETKFFVHGLVLLGTLLVLALFVGPLLRNAVTEIRQRRLTTEWLFLLTMFGASAASMQSFLTGSGPVYFEVVSVLLVVYSLGKAIGAKARTAALASTNVWAEHLNTCRILAGNEYRELDAGMIQPGLIVEVRPGETVTVDGIVRSGVGFISEAALRGEPFDSVARPGDRLLAGSVSHDATFRIEATTSGKTREVDQLLAIVEEARMEPISIQGTADRLAAFMLPLLVVTALTTFLVWTWLQDWTVGLFNAMSVLLVACPCALGLATPLVVWSALGRFAERGIVVRSGTVIEQLAMITHVVFDKTGTLTEERFRMVDIATFATGDERAMLLGLFSLVQEQSNHPMAKPFADWPRDVVPDKHVESFHTVPGCGVEAIVDGQSIRIGRPEWIAAPTALADKLLNQLHAVGQRVDCSVNGQLVAVAMLQERLRDSAPQAFTELERLGLHVEVLTGDSIERAKLLDLPHAQGGLLPDDKRQLIQQRQANGERVLMIGDGINDASALATADVGIAMSSGTDLANRSASATLYHADLCVIPWAVALARQALKIVRRNLILAATYNVIGIALAAFGVLHPVVAALLMVVSSVIVAWSASRVGVAVEHECSPVPLPDPSLFAKTFSHACTLILQGLILVSLFGLSEVQALALIAVSVVLGVFTAWLWSRWRAIPHAVDMAYLMLTFGNLGMIGGWWADAGFRALQGSAHCDCATAIFTGLWKPWMWIGMFAFSNLGMAFFARHQHTHQRAMYFGGNLGMGLGMLGGGWLAAQVPTSTLLGSGWLSLFGMTLGMVAGMWGGTWLLQRKQTRKEIATSIKTLNQIIRAPDRF